LSISGKNEQFEVAWKEPNEVIGIALDLLCEGNYVTDPQHTIKPRLLVKERWAVRTYIVFDIFHDNYNSGNAHILGHNDLSVIVVYLSNTNKVQLASEGIQAKTNAEVRDIHDKTGIGSEPPFEIDHMNGNIPSYPHPRTTKSLPP